MLKYSAIVGTSKNVSSFVAVNIPSRNEDSKLYINSSVINTSNKALHFEYRERNENKITDVKNKIEKTAYLMRHKNKHKLPTY